MLSRADAGSVNMNVVRELFNIFDKDGNGIIDESEDIAWLWRLFASVCVQMTVFQIGSSRMFVFIGMNISHF